jgi:YbbR domain-containing protein
VKLEQRKQSEFVVNVTTSGDPARGYEVGTTEVVQGKTVQIAGSESMLNRIGQVVATVNVSGISTDQRLRGELKIIDKNGDALTEAQMSRLQVKDSDGVLLSEDSVMVDVDLWEIMNDVPVAVEVSGTPAEGYRLADVSTIPVTVNVVGTAEALAQLNGKIVLKDPVSVEGCTESFTQDFDLNETLAETAQLRLVADASSNVSVSVQIEQTGDYTLTIPLSDLEIQNRPENMSLTVSPADEISIVVHSNENASDPIKVSDIKASIDLGVCTEEGTYEIPVEIQLPEGYTLASDVSLVVTAERQNQAVEGAEEE